MSSNISGMSILLQCSLQSSHQEQVTAFLLDRHFVPTKQNLENYPDLHFVHDEAENITIERVRELGQEISLTPYQGEKSIFVIFHIETASLPAQNALLKMLEEPPQHVQFVLTTERIERVLPTILSRCEVIRTTSSTQLKSKAEIDPEVVTLYQSLSHTSLSDIFTISEKYKEREEAQQLIQQFILLVHQRTQQQPTPQLVKQLQTLQQTQEWLEKNVNVRLAIEDCLFNLSGK